MTKNECVWNGKAKSAGDIEWDYLEWCSLKRASSIFKYGWKRSVIISRIKVNFDLNQSYTWKVLPRSFPFKVPNRDHSNITWAGFWTFSYPPTLFVLIVSKNGHFLNPSTQSNDYVIFERSHTKSRTIFTKQCQIKWKIVSNVLAFSQYMNKWHMVFCYQNSSDLLLEKISDLKK